MNVIPFRRREDPPVTNIAVTGTGPLKWGDCTELVHYFDAVPGNCKCGESYWDPPSDPVSSVPPDD